MRMKLYTLLCISFFLLFTACNQDDDPVPPEVGSRTVLVYIVADNNLSSFAKEDVEEMIAGMESVDLSSSNLLVYQDDRVAPVLFRISRNKKGRLEKEIIKEYAEQVSTKASVMKEVITVLSMNIRQTVTVWFTGRTQTAGFLIRYLRLLHAG